MTGVVGEPPLLSVEDLSTSLRHRGRDLEVVKHVSFCVERGASVGIVGESGSGKSMTLMSIMGLLDPRVARVTSGRAVFRTQDLLGLSRRRLSAIRGNEIAMIFQDPMSSLNPVLKVGHQIAQPLMRHKGLSRKAARRRAIELLDMVGIPSATTRIDQYPHEFSGGMCQRAMIAMALACEPSLLIADEPTTALDVTVQAQILDTLTSLRHDLGMAMIIVTHDLGVLAGSAEHVSVMYAGEIVEHGDVDTVLGAPRHPYTIGLLNSVPSAHARLRSEALPTIPGRPPRLDAPVEGCSFRPRCPHAVGECSVRSPALARVEPGLDHQVACWLDEPPDPGPAVGGPGPEEVDR